MINTADKDEVGGNESGDNKTNLLNPFMSKKSTGAGNLTFKSAKKGGGNTKKCVKAARGSDYLSPDAKKTFNHLRYMFTQAPIFQHFDPE